MKFIVVHLSDIHFEKKGDYSDENTDSIAKALMIPANITNILIVISGDVSFSGLKNQFIQAREFIGSLKSKIEDLYGVKAVDVAVVPGNHDVDYSGDCLSAAELSRLLEENCYEAFLAKEHHKLNNFYRYSREFTCFNDEKNRLVTLKKFAYEKVTLQVNLINTAVFSTLAEDQGFHYLPHDDLERLSVEDNVDFVFTVMHHPHHWYCWRMKKDLERVIYEQSDAIFVGHEHYSSEMSISSNDAKVQVYAGGELSNRGDWSQSEFYVLIVDGESREVSTKHYIWDKKSKIYTNKGEYRGKLEKNRMFKDCLIPKKEYMQMLMNDSKYLISNSFDDYYVFPLVEEQLSHEKRLPKEINELNRFIDEIEDKKKIIITGNSDTGKSSLAKKLYAHFSSGRYTIFVRGNEIWNNKFDNIVRSAFEDAYSTDYIEFEKFTQSAIEKKVIIIDDADEVDSLYVEKFNEYIEEKFGIVVQTSKKVLELDIKERIKQSSLLENYTEYAISPFYSDKREELVGKIVDIMVNQDNDSKHRIINLLCTALTKQRNLFNMDPDFIVKFTKYYCNNIGETIQNDGSIFSKVFESNIVSLLKPNAHQMSVDKILIILDKIAYRMHVDKQYPMKQNAIYEVVQKYNEEFDSDVNYNDFINVLIKSGIMKCTDSKYSFAERNYLAYFVAREIKRKCIEEQDYSEFNHILEYACFNINADILLFVTYITDNLNIIKMIMDKAEEYSNKWNEFKVNPISIPYLSDTNQLSVKKVEEGDRETAKAETVSREKAEVKSKEIKAISDVYGFDEDELTWLEELVRNISLSIVLSRTLPSFEHMMKKDDKDRCVKLIYTLPLKIFDIWAGKVEESKFELIAELKELQEWEYRKEKRVFEDYEILNQLRWESISLLMELMNSSMVNATKANTLRYIDSFSYNENAIYSIAHLMSLDSRDSVGEFIKTAENLYLGQKQNLIKLMVQRVAKHYMITSKKITWDNVQRLNSKLWDGKLKNSELLVQKKRNSKKDEV